MNATAIEYRQDVRFHFYPVEQGFSEVALLAEQRVNARRKDLE